ncbi:MAG TPA: hypothetical protein VF691_02185, partial [Cytophagaceae bacterium]
NNITAGTYECKVIYKKFIKPTPTKTIPWSYVINEIKQDSTTVGNWHKRYGREGFVLFNYNKNNENIQQLPSYATSISSNKSANIHIDVKNPGENILMDPSSKTRHLGALVTQDPQPTLQTMTVDLKIEGNEKHQLALYFLDWDSDIRRSTVEIYDLKTLKLLAPVQLLKNYRKGKYLIFDYQGSLRIRINHVRGENAALSGIFFDSSK